MASPTRDIEIQTEFVATALVNLEPEDLPSSQLNMSTVSVETNMDLSDENKSSMSNETADSSDTLSEHDYIDHNSDASPLNCSLDRDVSECDSDMNSFKLNSSSDISSCESYSDSSQSNLSSDHDVLGCDGDLNSDQVDSESNLPTGSVPLLENERQALKILSCFQKHNLSVSASKDILATMRSLFPSSEEVKVLDLEYIYSLVNADNTYSLKEVHYCEKCNSDFPEDPNEFKCNGDECDGLRYKGSLSNQNNRDRQPRKSFILADIQAQLKSLLKTPGIIQEIRQCKSQINDRKNDTVLTDIIDGSEYRKLLRPGGFLASNGLNYNLTAVINTDGINLYSSSKVELWPIFIAINELRPKHRFARENVLLLGIWQGKGKPPFQIFMEHVGAELDNMYTKGLELIVENKIIVAKLAIVCGVFDLPAKASLLNMTYFNGAESCITCEEIGVSVKQGKGNARCFPYKEETEKAKMRNHEEVAEQMKIGTAKKRVKGFKGVSGMLAIQSYDLVKGTVPDYMHGILLGITNMLLKKWFAPSESGKDYFIGKHIKLVSKRLQNIKPPQSIERLPRDLEKHFLSLKATELQVWLLFYAIPSLSGILPDRYLEHFACLSDAVYILLGDSISTAQLNQAAALLNKFYADFVKLYPAGSCGLNVHNACSHLVWYVSLWGPLWAWSTFPFEDTNSTILQAAHGTGNVMKQIMKYKHTESSLRQKGIQSTSTSLWKLSEEADNCDICGKIKSFAEHELNEDLVSALSNCIPQPVSEMKMADRIRVRGKQFSSRRYGRMQRRICYIVLYDSSTTSVGSLEYFIYSKISNLAFAVIKKYNTENTNCHLTKVRATNIVEIVPAEHLIDTLVYINVSLNSPPEEEYVALMPSAHGHAILK